MNGLRQRLIAQIRAQGPMPLAQFMTTCLMHPEHGYYATRDPFGAAGDFTTAPEISQMFGELVGLSLAQCWLDQGAPAPFILAEAGPGRGTMMADILRATKAVPGFHGAMQLHLIEASPTLRRIQQKTLGRGDVIWHEGFDDLPDLPLYLVANEFFDALPIRQVVREGGFWRERSVGVKDGNLSFGLSGPLAIAGLEPRLEDTQDGDIVEFCSQAQAAAAVIGQHVEAMGGAALIIDYGDWRSLGDTFQALENHAAADPLANPGQADLTAHVDFAALADATPSAYSRLTPQGVFLERLGIAQRTQALAAGLSGAALENHLAAHRRLTHGAEMGNLFKVMAFYPKGAAPPPGLNP
ncbi:SAM-dependent methyltransferase, MidA [hydrothermal vent metagenome]|uniref:SAM-dependent methyltransferase, MidA n=1 Tax=hydrothermal vent metagenome TaxID=652676 RepID=A0A3B0RY56_9ZZZZ